MTPFPRLSDWSMSVKFGLAPVLALLLMFVMAALEVAALHSVSADTRHIVSVNMRDAAKLSQIAARFQATDTDVYQLINLEAANPGAVDVAERAATILERLRTVRRDLSDFRDTPLGRSNRPRLDAALADIDQYSQAAGVVTSMVDIDFANAVAMLGNFHDYAGKVTTTIRQMAQAGIGEAGRRANVVNARVANTVTIFSVLVLISFPAIAIAAWLIGRSTVRSIRDIADATTRLAAADFELDISSLARKDELGAVVTALQTFRIQALEASRARMLEAESQGLYLAKTAAESANKAKSAFLANMSHELRTPLNAVLGYAQLLTRDPALTDRQASAAQTIQKSGAHLLTLITDILDLAKIEAGKLEILPAAIDLGGFLTLVADIIRLRAEEKALTFACDLPPTLPTLVLADEKRLRQVLLNLLGNAVKFTDHGQVVLRVEVIRTTAIGVRLRFEVRDSGVGIAPTEHETIFQPFEQVGQLQRRSSGTGLGLSISRQLVALMGSTISVDSTLGQGSCFAFELDLPTTVVEGRKQPAIAAISGYRGARRTILVVDDVPANRVMLADILSAIGFAVVEASDGLEGVRQAQATQPDLILMDVRMPVMDGLEATQRIRAIPALADIPIIAVSAGVAPEEQARSLTAGMNDFLAKPVEHDRLLWKIARHLPLEWIETDIDRPVPSEMSSAEDVAPPHAEIERLHALAMAGNMREIRVEADRLATLDPRWRGFAQKLATLARGYQSQAVLDLIEHHLDRKQVAL